MHRDTTAPIAPGRLLVRRLRPRPGAGGEGPVVRDRAGRRSSASTYRCARARAASDLGEGTGALMGKFDDLPEERRRGLEKMEEVYGFEMTDGDGRLLPLHRRPPVRRHLEPARPLRPRPPAAADRPAGRHRRRTTCSTIQVPGRATRTATSTTTALREIVIFLCHYAGWPNGARLNSLVEETIAKARGRGTSDHVRGAPAGGVGAAVRAPGPGPGGGGVRRARVRRPRHRRSSDGGHEPGGVRTRVAVRRPARAGLVQRHRRRGVAQRVVGLGRRARLDLPGRRDRPPRPRLGRGLRAARRRRGRRRRWSALSGWRRPASRPGSGTPRCSHPGDAYCYSIYASVAAALDDGPLADLVVDVRLAVGESQSAVRADHLRERRAPAGARSSTAS